MSDFFNNSVNRKCRKEKRCTYCGQMIKVGENYTHQTANYDGAWQETKMHLEVKAGAADTGHAFNSSKFTPKGVNWIAGEWAKFNLDAGDVN